MLYYLASDKDTTSKNYGELLQSVKPRKIETEQDYERFVALLEELLEREEDKSLPEQESLLLELLLVIVQEYESQNVNFPDSNPHDILIHLMEAQELKQFNLVGNIGSSGVVSEIVNGKREISKAQARSLGELFNVSYKLFL